MFMGSVVNNGYTPYDESIEYKMFFADKEEAKDWVEEKVLEISEPRYKEEYFWKNDCFEPKSFIPFYGQVEEVVLGKLYESRFGA